MHVEYAWERGDEEVGQVLYGKKHRFCQPVVCMSSIRIMNEVN